MGVSDAAGKMVAIDGGLGAGGSADGGAMGDAGVGEEAEGGESIIRSMGRLRGCWWRSIFQHLD